jgi:hypothetical protein
MNQCPSSQSGAVICQKDQSGMSPNNTLLAVLFKYGLGEHLILHIREQESILGNLYYDKGRLLLKDQELLTGFKPEYLKPCWEKGLIGMICSPRNKAWESLSFYGLEKCNLPVDLESTRHGSLTAAQNQYGEKLVDFVGSIYRGFNLMLDNHFLPVILLRQVHAKTGEIGLAVTDLRTAPMPISLIQKIHDLVREQIDMRLSLNVQDTDLAASDFESIFKQYLK